MKKVICFFIMLIMLNSNMVKSVTFESEDVDLYKRIMKQDILCLMIAYPDYVIDVEKDGSNNVYIVMNSGKKLLYDDKKDKNFQQKLDNADIQDMMEQYYPLFSIDKLMDANNDPGRIRYYPLLKEVYGYDKSSIQSNLKSVNIYGSNVLFNGNNQASKALQNTMKEIHYLASKNMTVKKHVYPINGTFNYRVIAGTKKLSPHAFAIAIDLARDSRDYWKWATKEQGQERLAYYPKELVEIFEKNNFIWGGKWSHFDILHFEYRPEIILKSRYFGKNSNGDMDWFQGAPVNNKKVKKYIDIINDKV